MRLTGVSVSRTLGGRSLVSSVPNPCRQKALLSRSTARERSTAETSLRSLPQAKGPSTNSRVCCHSPRSLGSALSARDVGLAARRGRDRGVGAHEARQEILELALARKTPADPHALAGRRRIDLDAAWAPEPDQRIDVGGMDPMRAAIERDAERLGVGDAAAADVAGRLEHDEAQPARGGKPPRRRDAGGAGTHHDDIDRAGFRRLGRPRGRRRRARRAERRPRAHGGGGGKERPSGKAFHRFQMQGVDRRHHAGMPLFPQFLWINPRVMTTRQMGRIKARRELVSLVPPSLPLRRFARRTGMLDAAVRALSQMFSPPFRAVLLKSVGLALVLIVLIGFGAAPCAGPGSRARAKAGPRACSAPPRICRSPSWPGSCRSRPASASSSDRSS